MIERKGGCNGDLQGRHRLDDPGAPARLNNFLSRTQWAAATRMYRRRLNYYHGLAWPQTGATGVRLHELLPDLPARVFNSMIADYAAHVGISGALAIDEQTWRGYPSWTRENIVYSALDDAIGLYRIRFDHGTIHIDRAGVYLGSLLIEPPEQWAAGDATHNPTGTLDQAPVGALRILCVCTIGLQTGVELRRKAERILRRMGVDAWLELTGRPDAAERSRFADVVLLTQDERLEAQTWGHPRAIVLRNIVDGREIRGRLAALPEVRARVGRTPATCRTLPG